MKYKLFLYIILAVFIFVIPAYAENYHATVSGTVQNEYGEPVDKAIICSELGKCMTFSDEEGKFLLLITDGSAYVSVNMEGYVVEKINAKTDQEVMLKLKPDVYGLEELVFNGFSSQRKGNVIGAVSSVSGEELAKTPVANLSATFSGRFSGLTAIETSSEWSRLGYDLLIRGTTADGTRAPVVIIDGFLIPNSPGQSFDYISPHEIQSVSVVKDASLLALYGIKGANGALVFTTKRGRPGSLRVDVHLDGSMQEVTVTPYRANSATYARLRNEAAYNDNPAGGRYQQFSEELISKFASGTDREHYPDNDWYKEYFGKYAYMQRAGVNLSGGNDRVTFFSNVNVMHQNTNFKVEENPKYDPTPNYFWANLRTNVNVKLNRYFNAFLNIAGNMKREKTTDGNMKDTYSGMFDLPPILYGGVTPEILDPETGEVIHEGGKILTSPNLNSSDNIYARLNRQGYVQHTVTNIYSNFGLEYDMSFITKGLKVSGTIGFQSNNVNSLYTRQDYERWVRVINSPEDWNTLKFEKKGTNEDSNLSYSKGIGQYYNVNYRGALHYARSFGKHSVSSMAYAMFQDIMTGDNLAYKRIYSGLEIFYDYDQKYLLSLSSGYSGSDQFAPGNRFHTTPAVAAGWVISRESFMEPVKWLDMLKLKVSYGLNGNDENGMPRYPYLNNIQGTSEFSIGNPAYEPEMVKKWNYGFELGLFRGLYVGLDIYRYKLDNMVMNATSLIPAYYGNVGSFPRINGGSRENKGYEIEASYTRKISRDLSFIVGGQVSFNENKYTYVNESLRTDDYAYKKRMIGYPVGQEWGYLVDYTNGNGFFNTQEELDEYRTRVSYSFNQPRLGDLKYRDINNDGVIDDKDVVPLGKGSIPRYNYSFHVGFQYKGFDISALFQGIGKYECSIAGALGINEGYFSDGLYSSTHLNAWTQERYENGDKITHPALTLQSASANTQSSDYFMIDRSYLRLKNMEIGYTLPAKVSNKLKAQKIRFSLNGQNLLTWDHLKDYDFGPETGNYNHLPVMRVYSIGAHVHF